MKELTIRSVYSNDFGEETFDGVYHISYPDDVSAKKIIKNTHKMLDDIKDGFSKEQIFESYKEVLGEDYLKSLNLDEEIYISDFYDLMSFIVETRHGWNFYIQKIDEVYNFDFNDFE